MPNWKPERLLVCLLSVGCAQGSVANEPTFIQDGEPITRKSISKYIDLSFDGKDAIKVIAKNRVFIINARTPSKLITSPSGKSFAFNFGDGSGQVLGLEIYHTPNPEPLGAQKLKDDIIESARAQGCAANPDSISIIFDKWIDNDSISVRTEDFSRQPRCSAFEGSWRVNL